MSLLWHSLIATVKIQDFSNWRFQNFGILAFLFSVKYLFCHQSNEHGFGLSTCSILSVSSPGFDKLCKKYIYGPFYGIGFNCFNVKNCLGYILPTPFWRVLRIISHICCSKLAQRFKWNIFNVLCSHEIISESVIEVKLEREFPARHEKLVHAKKS